MAQFCLTKQTILRFKKGLKDREIDPVKLAAMTSIERREFLSKYVGKENAVQTNALFESKLLLKNKKAGFISWAERVAGIAPEIKRDMLSRIEKLDRVLNPEEENMFLQDLASTRLKIDITAEEAKNISQLSRTITELRAKADSDGIFPNETQRMEYGAAKVAIEKYVNDLKLKSRQISFREAPIKKIVSAVKEAPGAMKSIVASLDNSFWGRQGIKVLADPLTSGIWVKNFLKSFGDIGKQLFAKGKWYSAGNDAAMDAIRADIYSRPNALNGKYDVGGYGLTVLSEEAFPSSLPERIPVFGRLFKASEVAYNGAALRLRADLADRFIAIAEKNGVNTLNKEEAQGLGHLVGSLTGRGSIGKAEVLSKEINVVLFSIKFLKSNFDTLTAHAFDPKASSSTKKQAAQALLRIIGTLASVLTIADAIDDDAVEEDPRSSNFGKIKIFGHWTDITGGMASLVTLASRLTPTVHEGKLGFWTKSSSGEYKSLISGEFGQQTALDVFDSFWQGKLSPFAGLIRDIWKGKNYQGQTVSIENSIPNLTTPTSLQNLNQLKSDPTSSFVLGSMILDGLGFSVSTSLPPNSKTNLIPEGKKIKNQNFIQIVSVYAQALGTDPETAFNRIFTGQRIRRVDNGAVIVERMPLSESQAIKRKANKDNPQVKLDHTIPLELGGSNDISNLKLVTTSRWSNYTKVENALGRALKSGKISKKEAQSVIYKLKAIEDPDEFNDYRDSILNRYK